MRSHILFYLNGKRQIVEGSNVFLSLSDYLRKQRQLTGTKIVCEEGDCGACTVVVGFLKFHEKEEKCSLQYQIINSCIHFLYQLDCAHVISIEGLTPNQAPLITNDFVFNEVQEKMMQYHGAQCGFCTPGFVTAMTDLAASSQERTLTRSQLQTAFSGNLCRCTGYEPILQAGLAVDCQKVSRYEQLYDHKPILADFHQYYRQDVFISAPHQEGATIEVLVPASVAELVNYYGKNPQAKLVAGASDIGVQYNKGRLKVAHYISLAKLDELRRLTENDDVFEIGALNSWAILEKFCQNIYPAFSNILNVFASPQIKNVATIGGNIVNASPIADSIPFLMAIGAVLTIQGGQKQKVVSRKVPIENFYKGYKQLDLSSGEFVASVALPKLSKNDELFLYKVSRRRDLDISSFTAAFCVSLNDEEDDPTITKIKIAYGGVGPVVMILKELEKLFTDKRISQLQEEDFFQTLAKTAQESITPLSDVRASKEYRFLLAKNILKKFIVELNRLYGRTIKFLS